MSARGSGPRVPGPIARVRRTLREIDRSSATRDRSPLVRVRNTLLVLSLLTAPVVPLLATHVVTREVEIGVVGLGLERRGGTIASVSADDDGGFAWTPTATMVGEARIVAVIEDRGWPITVARSLRLDRTVDLYLPPDSPRREDPELLAQVRAAIDEGVAVRAAVIPGRGPDELVRRLQRQRGGADPQIERIAVGTVLAALTWWVGTSMVLLAATPVVRWLLHVRSEVGHVRARTVRARGRCPACGYDLRGLEWSDRCPECGRLDV